MVIKHNSLRKIIIYSFKLFKILLNLVFLRPIGIFDLNNSLLSIRNLSISLFNKNKETRNLVRDISFDVKKGQIVGLVGESGSGKSITCLSIPALLNKNLRTTSGKIIYNGVDLIQLEEKDIRKFRGVEIAMVFQEPMSSFNPVMTCGAQVDEMIRLHKNTNKAKTKELTKLLFEKVQLHDVERAYNSYPHELSGGQLQRIMIAMAISCEPKLLIADECTTALDVTVQKEIIALLKELNKQLNLSIIFISHDLGVIKDIADYIVVMKNGEIVEQGSSNTIFNQAKQAYTNLLLASSPPADMTLRSLPKPELFYDQGDFSQAKVDDFYAKSRLTPKEIEDRKLEIDKASIILEAKNIEKKFALGNNFWGKPTAFMKAVDDVSFVLRKSETLGVVGESGSGKSTLSKSILQLIKTDNGTVKFMDRQLETLSPRELRTVRKDVQYIFQDPFSSLNPRLSIGYAIQEPMKVHSIRSTKKMRKEYTIELLEKVGMQADHYNRYPHEFSGGQRQRICIARALALEPKLLVCDEIVSALDVSVQAQVLNLLVDLRNDFDLSMIFVTHDLSIVRFLCERTLVMKSGKVVEEGWTDELFDNPQTDYTRILLNSIPGKRVLT